MRRYLLSIVSRVVLMFTSACSFSFISTVAIFPILSLDFNLQTSKQLQGVQGLLAAGC